MRSLRFGGDWGCGVVGLVRGTGGGAAGTEDDKTRNW